METGIITLAHYEARIALYKEQIGTGYIGIGRTLNEAKEAGAVPHGEWETWVERVTGLTIRQAQKCMQAAREIKDGSELARLEMSKAIMLLGSGLEEEEREELARKSTEEGGTVKQLRAEIEKVKAEKQAELDEAMQAVRQLKVQVVSETGAAAEIRESLRRAKAERDGLVNQLKATQEAYRKQIDQAEMEAYKRGAADQEKEIREEIRGEFLRKTDFLRQQKNTLDTQVEMLQKRISEKEKEISAQWDRGYNSARKELEEAKQAQATLESQLKELAEELEAAEEREAKKSRQLEELRSANQARQMDSARVSAQAFGGTDLAAAVRQFIGAAGVLPQMGSSLSRMPEDEREVIRDNIETVAAWVRGAMAAMGVVDAEGLVS